MESAPQPTNAIRAGRRMIESVPGVSLVSDLAWFADLEVWGVGCRIAIDSPDIDLVPAVTDWWVLIDPAYPLGDIKFMPAREKGIASTFPHQTYNVVGKPSVPWRLGEICVKAAQAAFGRHAYDPDPIGEDNRLAWYFERTIAWLHAAASGTLLSPGQPFELPMFPPANLTAHTVACCESDSSFAMWQECAERWGMAELVAVGPKKSHTFAVRRFFDPKGDQVLAYDWGIEISDSNRSVSPAIWIRIDHLPVRPPYQAPATWGKLREVFAENGQHLDQLLRSAVGAIRDRDPHLLLLGFPFPRIVGDAPDRINWQPILLPRLSCGTDYAPGFRANEEGYWRRDRSTLFGTNHNIDWHTSENWHPEEISNRGRFPDALADCTALVIGVGAIGGVVAELLLRGGLHRMAVIDDDELEQGNLCRHVLGLAAIGEQKAGAIAEGFNISLPYAKIRCLSGRFPPTSAIDIQHVDQCDLILDCTGEDATLHELARHNWERDRAFCSISVGYKSKRAYVFTSRGTRFPLEDFQERISSWLRKDANEFGEQALVHSGIGCWHPAFPARIDHVWMLAAASIRRLEEFLLGDECEPSLTVYEQITTDGEFSGIERK